MTRTSPSIALAVASGLVDIIDIELFNDEAPIRALIAEAHTAGVKVIMSNHDFQKHRRRKRSSPGYAACRSWAPICRK